MSEYWLSVVAVLGRIRRCSPVGGMLLEAGLRFRKPSASSNTFCRLQNECELSAIFLPPCFHSTIVDSNTLKSQTQLSVFFYKFPWLRYFLPSPFEGAYWVIFSLWLPNRMGSTLAMCFEWIQLCYNKLFSQLECWAMSGNANIKPSLFIQDSSNIQSIQHREAVSSWLLIGKS